MKPKLTPEEMKEISIRKWKFLVENPGRLMEIASVMPELEKFIGSCPYCNVYYDTLCEGCPVRVGKLNCVCDDHPFLQYINTRTSENAQKVLDIIENIKV